MGALCKKIKYYFLKLQAETQEEKDKWKNAIEHAQLFCQEPFLEKQSVKFFFFSLI